MAALLPASSLEHLPIVVEDLWSGRGTHVLFCDGGDAALPSSHDAGPLRFRERRNLVEFELEHLEMLPRQNGHADQVGRHDRDRSRQAQRGDDAPAPRPNQSRMFTGFLPLGRTTWPPA